MTSRSSSSLASLSCGWRLSSIDLLSCLLRCLLLSARRFALPLIKPIAANKAIKPATAPPPIAKFGFAAAQVLALSTCPLSVSFPPLKKSWNAVLASVSPGGAGAVSDTDAGAGAASDTFELENSKEESYSRVSSRETKFQRCRHLSRCKLYRAIPMAELQWIRR